MIYGFLSGKGGVGKTALVANIGCLISREKGKKVLLVDGNFTAPTLGLHFGVVPKEHTIIDSLNGTIGIRDAIYTHASGVSILPSSLSSESVCQDFSQLKAKLAEIKDGYDFILIDGASGIGKEALAAAEASDGIFIISEACLESAVAALRMVKTAAKAGVPIKGMVVNRVVRSRTDMTDKELEELWGNQVVCDMPFDASIMEGFSNQQPAVLGKRSIKSLPSLRKLASAVSGEEPAKKESLLGRIMKIFRMSR